MGLSNPWEIEQTWGSHQAVLKAVLEVMKPQSAIECGCGDFSTPHLQEVPNLHTIEHDQRWANKIVNDYPPPSTHYWTTFPLKAKNPTRINELPPGEFSRIIDFYTGWAESWSDPVDLLFVDTFTAARVPAILALGEMSNLIIVHDLEPPGPEVYSWDLLEDFIADLYCYIHKPMGAIGEGHQIPWTGLYAWKPLPLEELNAVVAVESKRLWGMDSGLEAQ